MAAHGEHEEVQPRSRRVGMASPPSGFSLEDVESPYKPLPRPPLSPPVPARSPLRPPPPPAKHRRTVSESHSCPQPYPDSPTIPTHEIYRESAYSDPMISLEVQSTLSTLLDSMSLESYTESLSGPMQLDRELKTLPLRVGSRSESPVLIDGDDASSSSSASRDSTAGQTSQTSNPLSTANINTPHSDNLPSKQMPQLTKRQHALHELLSSERAYASDLALVREVHIPLALGQQVSLHMPSSLAPGSRTLSTSSSSTASSATSGSTALSSVTSATSVSSNADSSSKSTIAAPDPANNGPPMTLDESRIIFNNIADLAMFSDMFCELLEEALGAEVEGGSGEDHVGEVFLSLIPELERPYKQYITKHPTALSHLNALPQTPALAAYLQQTQSIASSLSHAWDLPSLLIKPVQRLLKYSLLLGAIIDETPDSHSDKTNLVKAKAKMEEVARNVNEGRRRAEVVKEVLSSGGKKKHSVGVAASVNLGKMKSLKGNKSSSGAGGPAGVSTATPGYEGNEEALQVERMHAELKRIDTFAKEFAKSVIDWSRSMHHITVQLRLWAVSFGKVIGLSAEQGSEAFDAFLSVVESQLMPLSVTLESVITERLLKDIARLLATMNQPLKLLSSMNEQEPFHYHLMNMTVSPKNRPPASLLEASTNYLALRGQLYAELPDYIVLLHRGFATCVRKLAIIQTDFWRDVRDRWGELWEMLRVEGEMNGGAQETMAVWESRWTDVDQVLGAMTVVNARKVYQDLPRHSTGGGAVAAGVASMLASLDPAHAHGQGHGQSHGHPPVSNPLPLAPVRGRARGSSDATNTYNANTRRAGLSRRNSGESLKSGKTSGRYQQPAAKTTSRRGDEYADYVQHVSAPMPMQPRTKSMPLLTADGGGSAPGSGSGSGSNRSSSSSRMINVNANIPPDEDISYTYTHSPTSIDDKDRDRERGRTVRKSSLRRKFTDTLRPSTATRRRSPSAKSLPGSGPSDAVYFAVDPDAPPPPGPPSSTNGGTASSHASSTNGHSATSWARARAKYACQVVHPCRPPPGVSYFSFPFFTLVEGDVYEVLHEAGHPSVHPKLPLHVDDGADCLLLVRDRLGVVGWALASFLIPLEDI